MKNVLGALNRRFEQAEEIACKIQNMTPEIMQSEQEE